MNIFFSIVIFDKARQYLIHATRKCHENHNDILTYISKCYNEILVVKSIQKSTFEFYFCVSKVCFYLTNKESLVVGLGAQMEHSYSYLWLKCDHQYSTLMEFM
jgi:hypothetical protein